MARLPQPGGDNGAWGDLLNDFLSQSHKADGTFKDNSVTSNALAPNSVTSTHISSGAVDATRIANASITESLLDTNVQTKLNSTVDWTTLGNKPAVIAAGADAATARNAIGAQPLLSTAVTIVNSSVTLLSSHVGCVLRIPSGGTVVLAGGTVPIGGSVTLFAEGADGLTIDATSVTVLGGNVYLNVAQGVLAWVYRASANEWIVAGGTS